MKKDNERKKLGLTEQGQKEGLLDEGVERLREGKKNDSTIVRGKDGMMLQGRS